MTQSQVCNMAIPYWDWLLDWDKTPNDQFCTVLEDNNSKIWDANAFGSAKVETGTYYVIDGVCSNEAFETAKKTSSDWNDPMSSTRPNYDNYLKRHITCIPSTVEDSHIFGLSASMAMEAIVSRPKFEQLTSWLEGDPHATPHLWGGFSLGSMISPDDPLFWLHHCNIDRLYHAWVDCHGYENVPKTQLQPKHYFNTRSTYRDASYYSQSSQIPYYWDRAVTTVFKKINGVWPSPKDMWNSGLPGNPGYDGLNVRYGADQMIRGYGYTCPDKTWSIVDVGYVIPKKRDDSFTHPVLGESVRSFEAKVSAGLTHYEALREVAMAECLMGPKKQFGPQTLAWIKMMDLKVEQFDTICDKPSERIGIGRAEDNQAVNDLSSGIRMVPLWLIIVASVGSALLFIVIISIVIIVVRRRTSKAAENEGSYRQM